MHDETFKVGEIGILQNLEGAVEHFNGQEVEVVGGLEQRHVISLDGAKKYWVTYVISYGGYHVAVRPSNLRKKRPTIEEKALPRELEAV